MGKAVKKVFKTVVGIGLAVIGFVTGNPYLVAAGLAITAASLLPKPKLPDSKTNQVSEQRLSKRLEPEATRKIVFGRTAAPCDVRFWESYGPDNSKYVEVIAVATHRIHGWGPLYLNDELAAGEGAGTVTGNYASVLQVDRYNVGVSGDGKTPVGTGTKWNDFSSMTGLAYMILDWTYIQEKLPQGIPNRMTQVVMGAPVYDPRRDVSLGGTHDITDQNTWEYDALDSNGQHIGRNPALQQLWYQIGWRIGGKLVAGRGVDPVDLDLPSFMQAANDCEAAEYYSDCALSTGDSHSQNEAIISGACGGNLLDTGGKISFVVAVDDTANVAVYLNDDDIIGGVEWTPRDKLSAQFNEVAGTYIDPTSLYQAKPYVTVTEQSYVDYLGYRKRKSVNFGAIQDPEQAGRIAKHILNRGQVQGVFKANFTMRAFKARNWQCVRLTFSRYGWVNKLFRVTQQDLTPNGGIAMILEEDDPQVYLGGVIQIPNGPGAIDGDDPRAQIPVIGLSSQNISKVSGDGKMTQDGIRLNWTRPSTRVRVSEAMYRVAGTAAWTMAGTVTRGGADLDGFENTDSIEVFPLQTGTTYELRVRHISIFDVPGPWSVVTRVTGSTFQLDPGFLQIGLEALQDQIDAIEAGQASLEALQARIAEVSLSSTARMVLINEYLEKLGYRDGIPLGSVITEVETKTDTTAETVGLMGVRTPDGQGFILDSSKVQLTQENGQPVALVQRFNAMSAEIKSVDGKVTLARGEIQNEASIRASSDQVFVTNFNLLGARNSSGNAFILNENSVRLSQNGETLASRLDGMVTTSELTGALASYTNEIKIGTDANGSPYAYTISSLANQTDKNRASVNLLWEVQNADYAKATLSVTAGGYIAGWTAKAGAEGGSMTFLANRFAFVDQFSGRVLVPLVYEGGIWYFNADIRARNIDANVVRAEHIVGHAITDLRPFESPWAMSVGVGYQAEHLRGYYQSQGGQHLVSVYCELGTQTNNAAGAVIRLYSNGAEVGHGGIYCPGSWGGVGLTFPVGHTPGPGLVEYIVTYEGTRGSGAATANRTYVLVTELKR